jgi:hypothetical protein
MHPGPEAFLNQVVARRWRLLEVLCATEHGAAFRVEAVEDGRVARLELWDQRHVEGRGELARFEREARTLSRFRHERCLSLLAFGAHEGRPFLVSDLPDAEALSDEVGKAELTVARAVALGLQLCEGLRHLHRHGAVHRALLPENLWVAADVLTIGLPRIGPTADTGGATRERFYLPPERSAARLDHRADLYAAGMLLYVMCTGLEPTPEVAAAIAGGAPVPPPRVVSPERGISEALERVILRAVAPSPDVRFASADELVAALEAAGARQASPKRRPPSQQPRKRTTPRKRTAILATALAAVALLAASALRQSGGQGPTASPAAQTVQPPSIPAQTAVALPAPPRAVIAAAPVEPGPKAAPQPVPVRAAPIRTTSAGAPPQGERAEIWALLDSGRLDEGAARIKALLSKDPDAAWPRFALGALYYRRYWRPAAVKQWQLALAQDPELRQDPQFGAYLCFMLDDAWKAAGVEALLDQLGAEAAPLLERCVASAKTPRLRSLASRALERIPRTGRRPRR